MSHIIIKTLSHAAMHAFHLKQGSNWGVGLREGGKSVVALADQIWGF